MSRTGGFAESEQRRLDLHGAFIRRTNLRNTSLVRASFVHADCTGADFSSADLTDANFEGAKSYRRYLEERNYDAYQSQGGKTGRC